MHRIAFPIFLFDRASASSLLDIDIDRLGLERFKLKLIQGLEDPRMSYAVTGRLQAMRGTAEA